jgi:hypothetical protein
MTQAPKQETSWLPLASLPDPPETSRLLLEPLHEKHAELDYAALMSCRARLREELQWGEWPAEDFTLEANGADLRRHFDEFERQVAFAYTVLSPDRARCLGCVYLERCTEVDGAQLAFWVIDDALDVEAALVADVLNWVHQSWAIERVVLPFREANARGIALARRLRLGSWTSGNDGALSDHRSFLSQPCRIA